ncbi:Glu-tRNA(Gln) amidotransferase subunit GatD [Candidatus Woesearchaeota archaeon]|nr:Glu-tRNA(Gln) amidotransferase subunit GatD [Candidatus Woesearchaeota archaeon]
MTNAKPGDRVKVVADKEYEGVLMPNEETDSVVVKLDNGYNVGIEKGKVKEIKLVKKHEEKASKKAKHVHKKGLKTVSILHTGGTIASKVDYETGGVISKFEPEELIDMFPELDKIVNIKSRLVAQMFSEDMMFEHYPTMAKAIAEEIKKGADGIILTHGTDTMGYSAAALAFMLEDLPIPVIIVGAQRSSDRGSSDAGVNLVCAAQFIAKSDFVGVGVCMHEKMGDNTSVILPACKTRKLHTSRRDAFKPVNDSPIAKINFDSKKIDFLKEDYPKAEKGKKLKLKDKIEEKVALVKVHPNFKAEQLSAYKGYKGLVIEGTGLGQAPVGPGNEKNLKAIEELVKNDCIVVMSSQCIFGRTQMHVYSNAINLVKAGVIPGQDMLPETAFIKLAWLLGNFSREEAKELIGKNLRGEINERLMAEDFLKE